MHPILLKLGPLTIHTYGFFIALGFIVGISFAKKQGAKLGIDTEKLMDLCFYMLLVGLIGARLFYVAIEWDLYSKDLLEIFKIWNGGLVYFGGFISAMIFCVWYLKKHSISFLKTIDLLAPSLAIAHSIGRLGCFSAGCCYGKATDLPWSVTFTHPDTLAVQNIAIHPTQLYSSFMNLIIFVMLVILSRKNKTDGMISVAYLFLYGIGRSLVEIFRGDDRGAFFLNIFSPAQTIGLSMVAFSIVFFCYLKFYKNYNENR